MAVHPVNGPKYADLSPVCKEGKGREVLGEGERDAGENMTSRRILPADG